MSWHWSIATRYTRSTAQDRLISFMSLISIMGLVLGVAVLVIVLSVMNGFERELRQRVLGVLPHAVVYQDGGFPDWRTLSQQLIDVPGVEASAPIAEGAGLLVAHGEIAGVQFYGMDPLLERDVSILHQFVQAGSLDALGSGSFAIAIGRRLASSLDVTVGDTVTLVLPDAQLTLAGPLPRTRRLQVMALFEAGADIDLGQVLMHIDDANKLLRRTRVEAIRLRLTDLFAAPEVVLGITRQHDGLYGSTWMRRFGNLYDAIQLQKTTMFLLLMMLIAVAAFNVVSNLIMTVDEKKSDIAILRTMGASPGAIMLVFVIHGALIGALGIGAGIVLGSVIALRIGDLFPLLERMLGTGLMEEYFIQYLPSQLLLSDVLLVGGISLLICLVATLYPAWRASVAHPVEALQYDA